MEEIRFKPHHLWTEEAIVKRLARIINLRDYENVPCKKEQGYQYQLDRSNNWFCSFEDGEVILAYRYGSNREVLKGMQMFLEEVFG